MWPQDLGAVSYKSSETNEVTQQTQSIDTTGTVITETFISEEKILPNDKPDKQYEFATSFLKQGDYTTAERALREFVMTNPEHKMAGSAQYWYAETFRIRQLYTDAAASVYSCLILNVSAYQYCALPAILCSGFVITNSLNALSAVV